MFQSNSKYPNHSITVLQILSSAEIAGGERYINDLINYSSKLIRHFIILPYKGPFAHLLKKNGVRFTIVRMEHKRFFRTILEIIKIIRNNKVNVVHSHGYRANFYSRITCLLTKVKHITTVHVSLFDYKDTHIFIRYLYIIIESLLSFKTSKYICISKAMASDMRKIKIPPKKISTITNGVDLNKFYPRINKDEIKSELGLNSDTLLIGTAGRMVSEKGQVYLIHALKKLKNDKNNLQCLFMGSGPQLDIMKNKAIDIGVKDMCIFTGTRYDIDSVYAALDLFVLPSIREPFGLVLLEAMATKVPVIATASGGPSEFIKSGVNGMLVPPEDASALASAIKLVLQNKDKANKMAAEGKSTVEQFFDIKKTVEKVDSLYFSL